MSTGRVREPRRRAAGATVVVGCALFFAAQWSCTAVSSWTRVEPEPPFAGTSRLVRVAATRTYRPRAVDAPGAGWLVLWFLDLPFTFALETAGSPFIGLRYLLTDTERADRHAEPPTDRERLDELLRGDRHDPRHTNGGADADDEPDDELDDEPRAEGPR